MSKTLCPAVLLAALVTATSPGQSQDLPHGAIARLGGTQFRAPSGVASLAYSPDGELLAGCGGFPGVLIWDARTGELLRQLGISGKSAKELFFSSDGKCLTASDGALHTWDVGHWRATENVPLRTYHPQRTAAWARLRGKKYFLTFEQHAISVRSAAGDGTEEVLRVKVGERNMGRVLSPDEKLLAVSGADARQSEGRIEVWDLEKKEKRFDLSLDGKPCWLIEFTSDSKSLLASYYREEKVRQWDMETGEQQAAIDVIPRRPLLSSPDGRLIALFDEHSTYVYERSTGKRISQLKTSRFAVPRAFSPDGKRLATSRNTLVEVFDVDTGKRVFPRDEALLLSSSYYGVSGDGRRLATLYAPSRLVVWDVQSEKPLLDHAVEDAVGRVKFSPQGDYIAIGGKSFTLISTKNPAGSPSLESPHRDAAPYLATTSADATVMAEVEPSGLIRVRSFARRPGQPRQATLGLLGHYGSTTALHFSADHTCLASCGSDRTICVWNLDSGKRILKITREKNPDPCVALSPDASRVAGAVGERVHVWNVASGKVEAIMLADGEIRCLEFSPDGAKLVSGSETGEIRIFDTSDAKLVQRDGENNQPISILRYTPNGKSLCVGRRKMAEIRRASDLKRTAELEGLASVPCSVAFHEESGLMAAGDRVGVVAVWDLATCERRNRFRGNGGPLYLLTFDPEGEVVTCRDRDTYSRLDLATGRLASGRYSVSNSSEKRPLDFAFSPDGKTLATAVPTGIQLWDIEADEITTTFRTPEDCSATLAFSPTGDVLAAARQGITLFRLGDDSKPIYIDKHASGETLTLAFAPDGRLLASGGRERAVKFWDVATGSLLHTLPLRREIHDRRLAFSADGRVLFGYDRDFDQPPDHQIYLMMWETATGRPLVEQNFPLDHYQITADRRRLFSVADQGAYLVWDLQKIQEQPFSPKPEDPTDLGSLWSRLADEDAQTAYRAIGALAARPAEATALIAGRLKPAAASEKVKREDIVPLVEQLMSDNLAERRKASIQLRRLGPAARPALRLILNTNDKLPSAARSRIEILLASEATDQPREDLRDIRAIHVLERIETSRAAKLLESLARGAKGSRRTEEARKALSRRSASTED